MDTKVMDTIRAGGTLRFGDKLRSNNGNHELVMQHDGNLVLYQGIPHGPAPVWDTGTSSLPQLARPTHAQMQEDGNLVLYDSLGNPIWHSGTSMHPGSKLVLQDDRNLVIYDADDRAVWASHTATPLAIEPEDLHSAESAVKGIVEWETVGQKMDMRAEATLYRNCLLMVESDERNFNDFHALRGRVRVICVQANGAACAFSPLLECNTRVSKWEGLFTGTNEGRTIFDVHFPAVVGESAAYLDIYLSQGQDPVPNIDQWIYNFKKAEELYEQVKPYVEGLAQMAGTVMAGGGG